jgi:hypothetical protein
MNLDDLTPLWQAYKQDAQKENIWQEADIQLIIQQKSANQSLTSRLNYWLMNTGMYIFLILCTNGC